MLAGGIAIPQQVAVVGVGDEEATSMLSEIPISSVQLPPRAVGQAAAELFVFDWLTRLRLRPQIWLLSFWSLSFWSFVSLRSLVPSCPSCPHGRAPRSRFASLSQILDIDWIVPVTLTIS